MTDRKKILPKRDIIHLYFLIHLLVFVLALVVGAPNSIKTAAFPLDKLSHSLRVAPRPRRIHPGHESFMHRMMLIQACFKRRILMVRPGLSPKSFALNTDAVPVFQWN